MKKILFIIALFSMNVAMFAKPISVEQANKVAVMFASIEQIQTTYHPAQIMDYNDIPPMLELLEEGLANNTANLVLKSYINDFKNEYNIKKNSTQFLSGENENPLFYVFNVNDNSFVIVSGDDNVTPILGFSDEGTFSADNISPEVAYWLNNYNQQIKYVVDNNIEATPEIQSKWQDYLSGKTTSKFQAEVAPLLTTQWDQRPYYNDLAPEKCPAGCVAVAMAQVMKFWKHPAIGKGDHSYHHSVYGEIWAYFDSIPYLWHTMPNRVNRPNNAVATLLLHLGISVDMNYGTKASGAQSFGYSNSAADALKNYFGYKSSLLGTYRSGYTDSVWTKMIIDEINAGRPVYYDGHGSEGGHAFVCDGYKEDNFFHFNWGWGGMYNGYFYLNDLAPGPGGTGGGNGDFNSAQGAILGIMPATPVVEPDEIKIIGPADNAPDLIPDAITFSWEAVPNATKYEINFSTDCFFSTIANTVTTSETSITEQFDAFSKFYWQVTAYKGQSPFLFSQVRYFSASANAVTPTTPNLVFPINQAENIAPNQAKFEWNETEYTTCYTLRIGTTNFYTASAWVDYPEIYGTTFTLTNLNENTKYWWDVTAVYKNNNTTATSGKYQLTTGVTGIFDYSVVNEFSISPNPVSTTTAINFYLVDDYNIKLVIYDLAGNEIFTISNFYTSGKHALSLNLNNYLSGSYICKLFANDKMIASDNFIVNK